MRRLVGRPMRRGLDTFDDLLAKTVVLEGARRLRGEGEDRLLVGRALLQPDALRDDRLENAVPEHLADGLLDVARQRRAAVVERDDRAEQLEVRVRASPDLVDGLQQVVGALLDWTGIRRWVAATNAFTVIRPRAGGVSITTNS
jgi:hypothetical protein